MSQTMRAIEVTEFGGPEALTMVQRPVPQPRAGQVCIRVHAVGINFADVLSVNGEYLTRARLPFVPGMECAGVIEALGDGVDTLRVGQHVACLGGTGAFAEHAVVPAAAVFAVPETWSHAEAAALPVSFYTAYFALVTAACATPGQTIWVEAAAGAFGTASIQIAKTLGCTVIATASTKAKLELAASLGADHVFLSEQPETLEQVRKAAGQGVDVYLSVVGGPGFQDRLSAMNARGRVVVIGNASREEARLNPTSLLRNNVAVIGLWLTPLLRDVALLQEASGFIEPLLKNGSIKPVVGQRFALAEAGDAFRCILERRNTGKIILEPQR